MTIDHLQMAKRRLPEADFGQLATTHALIAIAERLDRLCDLIGQTREDARPPAAPVDDEE